MNRDMIRTRLRKVQPKSLRYRTCSDDEWQPMAIPAGPVRTVWIRTADSLIASDATKVQALSGDGEVLDTLVLADDDGGGARTPEESARRSAADDRAANAALAREFRVTAIEAFREAREATGQGLDSLVEIVRHLTAQWTVTMTSLHNVSQSLAQAIQAQGSDDHQDGQMSPQLQQILALAATRMIGSPPAAPPKTKE